MSGGCGSTLQVASAHDFKGLIALSKEELVHVRVDVLNVQVGAAVVRTVARVAAKCLSILPRAGRLQRLMLVFTSSRRWRLHFSVDQVDRSEYQVVVLLLRVSVPVSSGRHLFIH